LYQGLEIQELQSLLGTVFSLPSSSTVVGFSTEGGLVVPASLACRNPEVIPLSNSMLLVSETAAAASTNHASQPTRIADAPSPQNSGLTSQKSLPPFPSSSSQLNDREQILQVLTRLLVDDQLTSNQASVLQVQPNLKNRRFCSVYALFHLFPLSSFKFAHLYLIMLYLFFSLRSCAFHRVGFFLLLTQLQ